MNIGIVVDNDFNDDIRVRKEVRVLKDEGYNVFVLCFGYKGKKYKEIEGITIERIIIKKKIKDMLFASMNSIPFYNYLWHFKIKQFINKYNISILHVHDLYMSKPSFIGIKRANKRIPLILDLHENFPAAIKSYNWTKGTIRSIIVNANAWRKKEKEYLNYASKIVVLSEYFKNTLAQKYSSLNKDDIIVYPNVIDFKQFSNYSIDPNITRKGKITLLYFGGVAERRGVFEALDAFKSVLLKGYDIFFLIIGPVDKADKKRFFNEINSLSKENFEYIPWIDVSNLLSYLNISDICLAPFHKNPQHESGIANKLFQYMYGAKPIIASDCAPQKELIESSNCGLIYSDIEQFVDSIILLTENHELRKQMGENSRQALYEKFNPEKVDVNLTELYKQLQF